MIVTELCRLSEKKPNESIGFYTNMPQETMGTKILTRFSNSSKCEIRFHTESIRQNHFVDLHVRLLIKAKNIGTPVWHSSKVLINQEEFKNVYINI